MIGTLVRTRAAAVQTVSGGDVAANLAQAEPLIAEAAADGARLVVLPEYFGVFGAHATAELAAVREADGDGRQQLFLRASRRRTGSGSSAERCPWPAAIRRACAAHAWSTVPTGGGSRVTTRSTCSRSSAATSVTTKAGRSSGEPTS